MASFEKSSFFLNIFDVAKIMIWHNFDDFWGKSWFSMQILIFTMSEKLDQKSSLFQNYEQYLSTCEVFWAAKQV